MSFRNDTIVAQSTGRGRAALAAIRVSGPRAQFVVEAVAGPLPVPRRMTLRALRDAAGEVIDRGLVAWFPGPASFSGEDMAEFHVHGGAAVMTALLRRLCALEGIRIAEPGEFTRRAVLNGKLDLTAAEAIGDLIDAETEAQRRQAQRQLEGALGGAVSRWRDEVLTALALIEADLDFSDEGDVGEGLVEAAAAKLRIVQGEIEGALAEVSGERLREGFLVVIAGPPNAGKSSLLNYLAKRDVAIVSPHPGTTRDALEVHCDIGGFPVTLVDTAGVRAATDPVEREGVARAQARMRGADLVLWLTAVDSAGERVRPEKATDAMTVRSKVDLAESAQGISIVTGAGIDGLIEEIGRRASGAMSGGGLITRERHRAALRGAAEALGSALAGSKPAALLAEDVRGALGALGSITGHVGAEDVLDRIFATFCIGK
jgi:tRNA modification GTPase